MIAAIGHVHYLADRETGAVSYCPASPVGYDLGVPGVNGVPANCRTPGIASWVWTLSDGRGVSVAGTVTAPAKPTITFVTDRAYGTFLRTPSAKCWNHTASAPDPDLVGPRPFGFLPNEVLSVTRQNGSNVLLSGKVRGLLNELYTVNKTTHVIVGRTVHYTNSPRDVLHERFRALSTAPETPTPGKPLPFCGH